MSILADREKFRQCNIKGVSKALEIIEPNVALTSFDATKIVAVDTSQFGQAFLAYASMRAMRSQVGRKHLSRR